MIQWLKKVNSKINSGMDNFLDFLFKKKLLIFWFVLITIFTLALRIFAFPLIDNTDLTTFLIPWCNEIKTGGIKYFLTNYPKGYNYSMAYFYILTFTAKVGQNANQFAYIIKGFSVFFDFALAFILGLICYNLTKNKNSFLYGYSLALLVPTMFLNSSAWGQCDSIYTTFVALCLYLIIKNKPNWAMLSFGLSLAFKLQSVFFLPVILFLVVKKKIPFTSLFLMLISFVGINVFSLFMGADFYTAFIRCYVEQLSSFGMASMNFPNLYFLVDDHLHDGGTLQKASLMLFLLFTFAILFMVFAYLSKKEFKLTNTIIIKIALLFVTLIPYFLPRMHDRYLYIADALFVVLVATNFKKLFNAFLVWYPSLRCYVAFLFDEKVTGTTTSIIGSQLSQIIIALMVLLGIALLFIDVYKEVNDSQSNKKTLF